MISFPVLPLIRAYQGAGSVIYSLFQQGSPGNPAGERLPAIVRRQNQRRCKHRLMNLSPNTHPACARLWRPFPRRAVLAARRTLVAELLKSDALIFTILVTRHKIVGNIRGREERLPSPFSWSTRRRMGSSSGLAEAATSRRSGGFGGMAEGDALGKGATTSSSRAPELVTLECFQAY